MGSARRWYIYITSAISLQVVTWAVISLARSLFARGIRSDREFMAMQIAVIIIALPVFLVHWLWVQRLAREDISEKTALIRRIYIYVILAASLAPILFNIFELFAFQMQLLWEGALVSHILAVLVLAVVYVYHTKILAEDVKDKPPFGQNATIRRVYILSFSATGLWMTTTATINLLRWFLPATRISTYTINTGMEITPEIVRLVLGVIIWVMFWQWAQKLFLSSNDEELNSMARKIYLYLIVFITALGTVAAATLLLDGWISELFGISTGGESTGASDAFRVIFGMGLMWAYHTSILRQDAVATPEASRTSPIRRMYLYLVAAVGLITFLVGLTGIVGVLFNAIDSQSGFGEGIKDQLAWSLAAIIAGLPVWAIPWRALQIGASGDNGQAASNRRADVRKNYLYIFLLAATLTTLVNLIYIVFQILLLIFGERTGANMVGDLAESFAYALIAGGVLAFHGSVLRSDGNLDSIKQAERLAKIKVAVVDGENGNFGLLLRQSLSAQFPNMEISSIGLTDTASQTMGVQFDRKSVASSLAKADLIIGPWTIVMHGENESSDISAAVVDSPARKLLIPLQMVGWYWVGIEEWNIETLLEQTIGAVKQFLVDENLKASKPVGCVSIAGIIIGLLVLVILFSMIASILRV